MKKTLLSIACALCAASSLIAGVVVVSPTEIRIDGVNAGAPVDAIANNRALAPQIQTALVIYFQAKDAELAASKAELAATRALAMTVIQQARTAIVEGDWQAVQKAVDEAATPAAIRIAREKRAIADAAAAEAAEAEAAAAAVE